MQIDSRRAAWADYLRVFAIVLVVLGHSIQMVDSNFLHNLAFNYIYAFHMPLFMFISGYFSYKGEQLSFRLVKKRSLQLMIPFVCWPILLCVIKGRANEAFDVLGKTFYQPDLGLWFLYVLFVISLITYLSNKLARYLSHRFDSRLKIREEIVSLVVVYGLNVLFYMTEVTAYGLHLIVFHLVFFTIGYYLRKHEQAVAKHYSTILWVSLVFYLLNCPFFVLSERPTFYQYLNLGSIFSYVYKMVLGLSGCLWAYVVFRKYAHVKTSALAQYVAKNTLGIYVIHTNFTGLLGIDWSGVSEYAVVQVAVLFSFMFVVSLLWIALLSRFKVTSFLLLGK